MSRERMNSSPEYMVPPGAPNYRPRLRRRTMSIENTSLTEVITIYEKLKKSREQDPTNTDAFRPSSTTHFGFDIEESDFDESVPMEPFAGGPERSWLVDTAPGSQKILDFNKYKFMKNAKYMYFSGTTGLVQSAELEGLEYLISAGDQLQETKLNYVKLLKSKQYWLNIIDPSEKDLALLGNAFNVHDLTLRDIREGNTEEKIEVYKHYMFISLRLLSENDTSSQKQPKIRKSQEACNSNHETTKDNSDSVFLDINNPELVGDGDNQSIVSSASSSDEKDPMPFVEDVDFNILLFSDFIITIHDKNWNSIKDVLGFLNLLVTYGNSPLTPDWVLFSVFIELAQDAKYSVNYIEPKILNIKITETDSDTNRWIANGTELSRVLRKNFEYEFEIYKISRFVKPKMNILKLLKLKCNKRLGGTVIKLLSNICTEFEELLDELNHFSHILERSQDTFLTMASVQQSVEANDMGKVMKRISEVALIFLPVQAIGGFFGMNVKVPFQEYEDTTVPFWLIVVLSITLAICLYLVRKFILNRQTIRLRRPKCLRR